MRFLRSRRASSRRRESRPDELACRAAVRLMTDYLDGALPTSDADRLAAHLAGCPHCTEYLRQLQVATDLAGSIGPEPDEATIRSLAALYRNWRAESG
jgi:anti-sigma factor RsiW